MEKNCLSIPKSLMQNTYEKRYKSPANSPVLMTERVFRRSSIDVSEFKFGLHKRSERNSVDFFDSYSEKDFLFRSMQEQLTKVNGMKNKLETMYDPCENSSMALDIKEKTLENRKLAETIKNLSLSEELATQGSNSSKRLLSDIQVEEIEIAELKKKLSKMLNSSKKSENNKEIEQIHAENAEILEKIKTQKLIISRLNSVKMEASKIKDLNSRFKFAKEKCSILHAEKVKLSEELKKMRKENYVKVYGTSGENILELSRILTDLSKLSNISQANSGTNFKQDTVRNCKSVQEYLENIKKEAVKLRLKSADLYAEKCSKNCTPQ